MGSRASWLCGLGCVLAGCTTHVSLGDRADAGRERPPVDAGPHIALGDEFLLDEAKFNTVDTENVAIAFDGTMYLAAWSLPSGVRALRLGLAGESLDATPIEITDSRLAVTGGRGGPHVAALPGRFAIVWDHADSVYATLVTSVDGQPHGVRPLGGGYWPASRDFEYALTSDDTQFLLVASDLSTNVSVEPLLETVYGIRLTSRRAAARLTERASRGLALAAHGEQSLLVWQSGGEEPTRIVARPAGQAGARLSEALDPVTIATVPTDGIHHLSLVGVTPLGDQALIVWQERAGGVSPGQKTRMRRVRLDDPTHGDASPTTVFEAAGAAGMARPESGVLVVSSPITTGCYPDATTGCLLTSSPLTGVTDPRALAWFSALDGPSVVALGLGADRGLRIQRIDPTARFDVIPVGALGREPTRRDGLATACARDVCLVAWLEDRTWRGEYEVYARRFKRTTGEMMIDEPGFSVSAPRVLWESSFAPGLPHLCVASDGRDFLVGWYASGGSGGVATRIVPAVGDPASSPGPLVERAATQAAPACAWDGDSYVVLHVDKGARDVAGVWMRRLDGNGAERGGPARLIVPAPDVMSELAIASNGENGSMFLWVQGGDPGTSGTYVAPLARGEPSAGTGRSVTTMLASSATAAASGNFYVFAYEGESDHSFLSIIDASSGDVVGQSIGADLVATQRNPFVTLTPRGVVVTFDRRSLPAGPWETRSMLVPLRLEDGLLALPAFTGTSATGLSPAGAQGIDTGYVVFYRDGVDTAAYDPRDRPPIRGRVIVLPPM